MEEEQKQAQKEADTNIVELIQTNNIAALIKMDQEKWDACLIKTGPGSYVMDAYGLPKQQRGVQQPDWVYKRCKYLKSLSVGERNFILTGDSAFAFDPVPYTIIYDCFTYANIVRGLAPVQVIEPPQAVPNLVQVIPAPVQVIKPPQVVPNPVQVISAPVQVNKPPQVEPNLVQVVPAPAETVKPTIIVPMILQQQEPEPQINSEFADILELEDDSNPTSPELPTLLISKPSDLFQIDTLYLHTNKTLTLILHVPMVSEENKLNLLQFIPFLLSQSLGANTAVTPKVNKDIIAVGKDHQYKILGQTDLAGCTKLGQNFLCKGRSV